MHNIEFTGTKTVLSLPENGYQFTRQQRIDFAGLTFLWYSGQLTWQQYKVQLVYAFCNLKRSATLKDDADSFRIAENLQQLCQLVEAYFITERRSGKEIKVPQNHHHLQVIPWVNIRWKKLYGPADALTNTTYAEYLDTLNAFHNFSMYGKEEHLNELCAILYRPKKAFNRLRKYFPGYKADVRRTYNPNLTQRYIKYTKKLPIAVKYAIYLYVASSQHFIVTATHLDIGGGTTVDLSILFDKEPNHTPGIGMVGTLYSIAETRVFGNTNEVANQNTYDVLVYLVNQKLKYKQLERNAKNNRS